jgi:hypothetical protein
VVAKVRRHSNLIASVAAAMAAAVVNLMVAFDPVNI